MSKAMPDADYSADEASTSSKSMESGISILRRNGFDTSGNDLRDSGRVAMHWAALRGYESVVQFLLDRMADPDSKTPSGETALHAAASKGHKAVVTMLAESGADLNAKDASGWTPLHTAARARQTSVLKLLLDLGADVNARGNEDFAILHSIASEGTFDMAEVLIRKGADVNATDIYGIKPLARLADKNYGLNPPYRKRDGWDEELAQLLIKNGAGVNSKDTWGATALHRAAAQGNLLMIRTLVENGADANAEDNDGKPPFEWAKSHEEARGLLVSLSETVSHPRSNAKTDKEMAVTSLISAAKNGEVPLVRKALDDGADRNGKDDEGLTALHHAVSQGYKDIVQMLLNEKVDANAKDNTDRTPLSWAAAGGTDKAAELLLAVDRIDPNAPDKDGKTPIAWAAQCGKDRVAKLLLAWKGIDVNATDKDGSTPLLWAACRGNTAVLKLLLACEDVKPNEKDKDGLTPLSWAAQRGNDACVKRLLAWDGIDANTRDNEGSTPLLWAACRGQAGSVRLLLAHDGINPDPKDMNGRTPLSWAADRGHDDALKLLIAHKGVDIQSTDMDGSTPLLWAACHGHETTVSLLIAKGADQDIEDKDDWTPLDWAKHRGYEAVVELLQSAAEGVEIDSSETWHEVPSGEDRKGFRSLPVRPNLRSYLFDDKSTDFSQRTIVAADEWMKRYKELLENTIDPLIAGGGAQDAKTTKVKVAVLDSGVDWENNDIYLAYKKKPRQILGYKNFVGDRKDIPENNKSCVDDDFGHGTHVTTLVLNTSLGTEVYVGRIAHEGKLADPEHVAKAIMWATDVWKVDIISMSMGFDRLDLTVSDAIKHAYSVDVIMLAAAANHGGNAKIAFPADQYSMVLGINSTDGYGNPSSFTPSPGPLRENYSVLGEGVESGWPEKLGGPTMRKGGTSYATPIAAGLAATLLYYAKVKFPKREGSRRFGNVGKMRAMLSIIGNDRQDYKYLAPFSFFETKSDRLVYETFANIWENYD